MSPVPLLAAALLALSAGIAHSQTSSSVRVTESTAVVERPDGSSTAVATASPGQIFEVLDERNGWLLVRPPAGSTALWRTGWINRASTQPMTEAAPAAPVTQPAPPEPPRGGRKGFIIGLGGGVGLHHASETFAVGLGRTQTITSNSVGLTTEFDIGWAPTDRLLVYYANQIQFSTDSRYDIVGLTGGGVTYAFRTRSPSWYITGAIGAATGAEADFGGGTFGEVERGLAYSVGGGYEFARHWFLGGTAMFLQLDQNTHSVLRGTITWMFY